MNTIITAQPDIVSRRRRTPAENDLLDRTRSRASWIWVPESVPQPNGAVNEQRAFRKTYAYQASRGKPKSAIIMVTGDDFAAMYVNGVLVAPANPTLDWTVIVAYEVPLPLVQGDNSTSLLLGFRVINRGGEAGLLAGVLVNYDDGLPPDEFYTGSDQTWLGERLFQEHWEHPIFDSMQALSSWRPAVIFSSSVRTPSRPGAVADEVIVLGQLPPLTPPSIQEGSTGGPVDQSSGQCTGKGSGVALSAGGLAGVVIATAVVAMVIGAVASYFVTKRRSKRDYEIYEGVVSPQTLPGRQAPPYVE